MATSSLSVEKRAKTATAAPEDRPVPVLRGICTTCARSPQCTWTRSEGNPILHCDDFFVEGAARTASYGEEAGAIVQREPVLDTGKAFGLCVDCGVRATCSLSRPASGVWRCEEYV